MNIAILLCCCNSLLVCVQFPRQDLQYICYNDLTNLQYIYCNSYSISPDCQVDNNTYTYQQVGVFCQKNTYNCQKTLTFASLSPKTITVFQSPPDTYSIALTTPYPFVTDSLGNWRGSFAINNIDVANCDFKIAVAICDQLQTFTVPDHFTVKATGFEPFAHGFVVPEPASCILFCLVPFLANRRK